MLSAMSSSSESTTDSTSPDRSTSSESSDELVTDVIVSVWLVSLEWDNRLPLSYSSGGMPAVSWGRDERQTYVKNTFIML